MSKTIIVIAIIIVVLAVGYFLFFRSTSQLAPSVNQSSSSQSIIQPTVTEQPSVSQAPAAKENVVTYTDLGYSPSTITIKKGETVIFKNQSSRSMWTASAVHPTHRVYSGTSLDEHCPDTTGTAFDACKGFLPGESWSFIFNKTGTWKYHDHLNPGSVGTIIVE